MKDFNYDEWQSKYHNEEFIDLKKFLDSKDIELLKKLDINIKDKLYSNYEFDTLEGMLLRYYRNEKEMSEEDLKLSKTLDNTGVSREDYNSLLEKFNKISDYYNI